MLKKIAIGALIFLAGGVFLLQIAFGEEVQISSTRNNSNITLNDSSEDGGWFFTLSTSTLDFIGSRLVVRAQLTENGYGTRQGTLAIKNLSSGLDIASSTITLFYVDTGDPNNASATINWEFGSPLEFSAANSYQVRFTPSWTPSDHPFTLIQVCDGSVPSDCYGTPYGINSTSSMISEANTLPGLTHPFVSPDAPIFTIYGEEAPTLGVDFYFPTQGTSTGDFPFWNLILENSTTTDSFWFEVKYGLVSSSPAYADKQLFAWNSITDNRLLPKTQALIYPPLADGVEWYAQAFLYPENASTTAVASSSLIGFNVYFTTGTYGTYSTSTLAETELSCNSGNWFSDGLCSAIAFLFYPAPDALDIFSNLPEAVGQKPPFGYFGEIKDALSGLQNGTSSIVLMDASTTTAFSGVFTPLRTGLTWILWFFFALWLFGRAKHLEL